MSDILPNPRLDGDTSVERALQHRRSIREFSNAPLTTGEVSQLLWAMQGITHAEGLRTAPSAGALYPLEAYVVVGHVEGLETGVYKYLHGKHQLVSMSREDRRSDLAAAARGQAWISNAAILMVFAGVLERTAQKYGQRGERYMHIEVGHASQNVFLQAEALGLAAAVVGAFNDQDVKKVMAMPAGERALYMMPIGRR